MTVKENDNAGEEKTTTPEWQDNSSADPKEIRHAQQMAWSKAEVERLANIAFEAQVKLAEQDAWNLLELHEKDPKLAERVAQHFKYPSFEAAKSTFVKWNSVEKKVDDDFDTRYQAKRAEERHQEALEQANTFIDKAKLPPELAEQAKEYFDDITKGRQLTPSEALKFADIATTYVQKDTTNEKKYQDWLKKMSATWISNSNRQANVADDDISKMIIRNWVLIPDPSLDSNKKK